jgi:hypothetical protein
MPAMSGKINLKKKVTSSSKHCNYTKILNRIKVARK